MRRSVSSFAACIAILATFIFLFLIAANAPASIVAQLLRAQVTGLSYSSVEGTLWRGQMKDVVLGRVNIGEVTYKLEPASVLMFRPVLRLDLRGGAVEGPLSVFASSRTLTIDEAKISLQLASFVQTKTLGLPMTGTAELNIDRIVWSRQGCDGAELNVSTNFLRQPAQQWGGQGFVMAGPGKCVDKNFELDLSGEGSDGAAQLLLTMRPDYSFDIRANVTPARLDVARALTIAGFERRNGAMTYKASGILRNLAL